MSMRHVAALALAVLVVTACAGSTGSPPASPDGSPSASPARPLTIAELRYRLIDEFGPPWFCDPDEYPVGRDELASMRERFPAIEADRDALEAIRAWLALAPGGDLTDEQRLAIYREWKALAAVALDPIGDGRYHFDHLARPAAGAAEGRQTAGTIDERGGLVVDHEAPAGEPTCPICLAPGTEISTPDGPRPIADLRPGDPVWTVDAAGARVEGTVIAVGSRVAPVWHRLVEVVLSDGRAVSASPGHPLPDGRRIGTFRPGDVVDGSTVVRVDRVPSGPATFDLLPSGPVGTYWADGIPLGSTLRP